MRELGRHEGREGGGCGGAPWVDGVVDGVGVEGREEEVGEEREVADGRVADLHGGGWGRWELVGAEKRGRWGFG